MAGETPALPGAIAPAMICGNSCAGPALVYHICTHHTSPKPLPPMPLTFSLDHPRLRMRP